MRTDERMTAFINSMNPGLPPFLESLRKEAEAAGVPIIRRETEAFLKTWIAAVRPASILEIGTAVGFSAILMAACGPSNTQITTIEDYEKRIPAAQENFRKSGYADRIHLICGDAADVLKTLTGPFDFVFMDAAKGQYIHFLPDVLRLMKKGSVLLADNVLQGGDVIESHYIVERRNRTIYKRMRDYLYAITHDDRLVTSIVPVGDGVSVSVMK